MELVPEAPERLRRMIRLLLVFVAMASSSAAQTWPPRLGDEGGVLYEYPAPIAGWFGRTLRPGSSGILRPDAAAVRRLSEHAGIAIDDLVYESRSAHIAAVRPARDGEESDGFRYAVFASAQPAESGVRLHRTWFRFRSPDDARGLAVVMPGMLGTPHEFIDRFERALLANGWAVLRMLVPPSRSTEYLRTTIDTSNPDNALRLLAAELDQRSAECAFAVEAGLAWAASIEPSLSGRPRVIVGMSGTGMMLPAVLARCEGGFDAGIIIASGANAFKILRETSYADLLDSVRVTWEPAVPTDERLAELDRMYLEYASLDAFHLAPGVAGVPMLLIHGSADTAVPAVSGDLLWERLGMPERWTTPVGHELLFVRTLLQLQKMADWLRAQTEEAKP
jgi:hypothetical protein